MSTRARYLDASPEALALLSLRAQRLRRFPAEEEQVALEVAEFSAGHERYAFPLTSLHAALPLKAVAQVPYAPPHVIGILRFAGQIVPALSFASLVGASGWRQDPAVLVVVDGGGSLVALDSEDIPRVRQISLERVQQARAFSGGAVIPLIIDGARLNLVDVPLLLRRAGAGHAS